MSIRRRLQALERQVERPTYQVHLTMLDEAGQQWKLTGEGTWVPVEPGELDGALVITLDFEGGEP
jgi:hypothetical protein